MKKRVNVRPGNTEREKGEGGGKRDARALNRDLMNSKMKRAHR